MILLGIDPGFSGALAAVDSSTRQLVGLIDMPTINVVRGGSRKPEINPHAISSFVSEHNCSLAYLEQVQSRPGQGLSSTFRFGEGFGLVQGVLAMLGVPVTKITPQTWIKAMRVVAPATSTADSSRKDASRARAMELFPGHAHLFAAKSHDGRAEAALIALYGCRDAGLGAAA